MALFKRRTTKSADKAKTAEKDAQITNQSSAKENRSAKSAGSSSAKPTTQAKVAYKVLVHPLMTEKISLQNALNQYSFMVDSRANKVEVKKAVQELYGVKPVKVRIINVMGKLVPSGRGKYTRRKSWKKAIVTLPAGKKIDIYEGL